MVAKERQMEVGYLSAKKEANLSASEIPGVDKRKTHAQITLNSLYMLPVALARSYSDGNVLSITYRKRMARQTKTNKSSSKDKITNVNVLRRYRTPRGLLENTKKKNLLRLQIRR